VQINLNHQNLLLLKYEFPKTGFLLVLMEKGFLQQTKNLKMLKATKEALLENKILRTLILQRLVFN